MRSQVTLRALRALVWKEWREHRLVMVAALVLISLVSMPPWVDEEEPDVWSGVGFHLLNLAVAIVAGRLVASEGAAGTLSFLLSQPIPRAAIWAVKLGLGLVCLCALGALRLCLQPIALTFEHPTAAALWFLFFPALSFAVAFLLSCLVHNTVLAAVGGFIAPYAQLVLLSLVIAALERWQGALRVPGLEDALDSHLEVVCSVPALLCLGLSWFAFRLRTRG